MSLAIISFQLICGQTVKYSTAWFGPNANPVPEFTDARTAVVEAIFRIFLVNGNTPMSAEDLSKRLGRPADTILRTIAGPRVYRGLRPFEENVLIADAG